ncbi:hypothetical protein DFJ74DRAFT_671559 [Hyaloraphidium curvatum]|nr:hypothetical protein DFJ74DRAFT_671559 [Hyaloraphidium curvatum]
MQGPPGDWSGGPGAPGMFAVRPHSPAGAPPSAVGPFVCHICAKQFARANNLKSHMLSHSQEKPYKCRYCDMAFVRAYDQRRHERGHTTESKAFTCQYCGKGFTWECSSHLSWEFPLTPFRPPSCRPIGSPHPAPIPHPNHPAAAEKPSDLR